MALSRCGPKLPLPFPNRLRRQLTRGNCPKLPIFLGGGGPQGNDQINIRDD